VSIRARAGNYNSDLRPTTSGGAGTAAPRSQPKAAARRPADAAAVDEFLHLLARAVQQFHTYPPTSPLCLSAIDACQRALVMLEGREQVDFRVTPRELVVDDVPMGSGTLVEQELARRLHAASIAQVTIERVASSRELARLCFDLVQCDARHGIREQLIDVLEEHGVSRISLRVAHRPQVLPVGVPPPPLAELIDHQRATRDEALASGGPVDHLYPPDKGWVRIDPTVPFDQVSLADLALLTQDPAMLAGMLLRLTEDDVTDGADDALSRKFSDVAKVFAALDPRVSRVMFGKLAQAVLDLEPEPRQALLRRTILPGLLDGRIDGTVLRDFPDVDLAESLCLLLDLETAAPEVVTSALARLDLPAERQAQLLPLVESRAQSRVQSRPGGQAQDGGLDAHARKLMKIDRAKARSFAEFAAFDLALDEETLATLHEIHQTILASDLVITQIACLWNLVCLEPNPEMVQRFLDRTARLLEALEGEGRWVELAAWLARYRELAGTLAEPRPDVADVISASFAGFCSLDRAMRLVELAEQSEEGRAAAGTIIGALGADIAPALLEAVRVRPVNGKDSNGRAAVQLLCDHATLVAPALVSSLGEADEVMHRAIARVLGLAGTGYEAPLGRLLESRDEQTVREAFRSLAKIGTSRAATLVGAEIEKHRGWVGGAAEQTLWHFPRNESDRQIRELLARRDFVIRRPDVAGRLLDRAAQSNSTHLAPVLQALVPLRYRFWNPALVRVARQAKTLLTR
jgi:hypothetical protein